MYKRIIALVVIVFMLVAGGILAVFMKHDLPSIKSFNLDEYEYYLDNFQSEIIAGKIFDVEDLLKKTKNTFIELYGECSNEIYQIFYDEQNGVWLVQETMPANQMGGVASMIIENDTGEVLAVWHGK